MTRFRQSSRMLAGLFLPLLVVAWLGAAMAPCGGMNAAAADVGDAALDDSTHLGHSVQAAPSFRTHAHSAVHEHGDCPHCPPSGGGEQGKTSASHEGCDEAEGVRDTRGLTLSKWDPKQAQAATWRAVPEPPFSAHRPRFTLNTAMSPLAGVPLNIRYCTYLI